MATILLIAAPAGAQRSADMPTELWSAYPLVRKVERSQPSEPTGQPSAIGPLLPPTDPEAAPASGESTNWGVWLAALALGFFALLFVARTVPPVAESGIRRFRGQIASRPRRRTPTPRPAQPRVHAPSPRAPVRRRPEQYAPLPPVAVAEPDIEREPRRSVVRRTGLLRSRFVVVADEPGGKASRVERSRSFWRVGGEERRERAADDAWMDLVNELRSAGWEPDSPRSDYYVLLRRIDDETPSIMPTLEAYTLADDPKD